MSVPEPALTLREVALQLAISDDVARYLLRSKQLQGFKAGGRWRIPPESLTNYIIEQLSKQ